MAGGAFDFVALGVESELLVAAWTLIEHGVHILCLVFTLYLDTCPFLELKLVIGKGGVDPFHDLRHCKCLGLFLGDDLSCLHLDSSPVGSTGPLGVSQACALNVGGIYRNTEYLDGLGNGR